MYFIVVKTKNNLRSIDDVTEDWHSFADGLEPIDALNEETVVYDESGRKYLIGPQKNLTKRKLFGNVSWVDVGQWDFKGGEPYLIDTKKTDSKLLKELLVQYLVRGHKYPKEDLVGLKLTQLIEQVRAVRK